MEGFRGIGVLLLAVGHASASSANYSSTCTHHCDECKGGRIAQAATAAQAIAPLAATIVKNPWYTSDAFGACETRNNKTPSFYTYDFTCRNASSLEIRDEASCMLVGNNSVNTPLGEFVTMFTSAGCQIQARGPKMYKLGNIDFQVCFGTIEWTWILLSQLAALAIGVAMGVASGRHRPDRNVENKGKSWKMFGPGAKMVAKNHCVSGSRRAYVTFYRFIQVVANAWFPITLAWFFSPAIVVPLYFLLYWLPAFAAVGVGVISKPRHLITVASCSLLGISEDQDVAVYQYLISLLRPPIMLAGTYGIGWLVAAFGRHRGFSDNEIAGWVFNRQAYLNQGFNNHWGNVVFSFEVVLTILGTVAYMALSVPHVFKSLADRPYDGELITLEEDDELYAEVDALAKQICEAAYADLKDDQDRVDDLEVKTQSYFGTIFKLCIALSHVFSYVYKSITFLRSSKYLLAAFMTFACAEAFTVLVYHGHLQAVGDAFKKTAKAGVPTAHFLALVSWDHGLAGIPSLMLAVYGLPLVQPTQISAFVSMYVLLSGTLALAKYLGDVADAGMYEVPQTNVFAGFADLTGHDDEDEDE